MQSDGSGNLPVICWEGDVFDPHPDAILFITGTGTRVDPMDRDILSTYSYATFIQEGFSGRICVGIYSP